MKIWKIAMCLLAVLLLAGCVSGATIDSATITLNAPATGVKEKLTYSSGITVNVDWTPSFTDTFNPETTYSAKLTVKNSSGNTLANTVTIKLNGDSKTYTPSNGKIEITKEFPKTAKAVEIDDIRCELEEPKASNTPATSVTFPKSTSGLKSTVTWDTNDKFVMGKKYTATVVIESTNEKAYPITSTATVKFNGESITDFTREGNKKITFTYKFDEAEPKGVADALSFTVNAPSVGSNPSNSLRLNSHSDKISATLKWDTTSAFQPDKPYTATITVYANDGYIIKDGATAKVNGDSAIIIRESSSKATVTYTFAQITSVNSVNVNFAAPATGEIAKTTASAVTTTPSGAANSATISWTPALVEGEFDAGVEYMASVTIPVSTANTVFDAETIVYINGEKAQTSLSKDYKTITATYTFPKTTFIPNPIEIIKEMFNLMLAIFNPASYIFL